MCVQFFVIQRDDAEVLVKVNDEKESSKVSGELY